MDIELLKFDLGYLMNGHYPLCFNGMHYGISLLQFAWNNFEQQKT